MSCNSYDNFGVLAKVLTKETAPVFVKLGKAVLVIMRTASFYGDTDIKNYLDGKYIGGDKDNCYFMNDVKPGTHYLTADGGNKDTVRMNFEAGRIYFFRQGVAPGDLDHLHQFE